MRCPFCGNTDTQVKDSRPAEDNVSIRRRRFCPACAGRFTTYERVQLRDLIIMKKDNRREIFELETTINQNKAMVYATRATIEQNYTSIMRNYSSTFMGNHNLTAQNTDNLFRNRVAILTNMDVDGEVEINFRESMTNEANLDFLEMQATVNELVLEINNR